MRVAGVDSFASSVDSGLLRRPDRLKVLEKPLDFESEVHWAYNCRLRAAIPGHNIWCIPCTRKKRIL